MTTTRQIHQEAAGISRTYQELLNHFSEFCSAAKDIAGDRQNPLVGIEFPSANDQHRFRATWAGRTIEFRFAVVVGDTGTKGRITCVEIQTDETLEPPRVLCVSSFNRRGVLEDNLPDDAEDEMEVGYPMAAWYLLASAFINAVRR